MYSTCLYESLGLLCVRCTGAASSTALEDHDNLRKKASLSLVVFRYCIATKLDGSPCDGGPKKASNKRPNRYIPYCAYCQKHGDPSLGVVEHPFFGKMLIAKRALPVGYKSALFGDLVRNENMPNKDEEWGFETADNKWTVWRFHHDIVYSSNRIHDKSGYFIGIHRLSTCCSLWAYSSTADCNKWTVTCFIGVFISVGESLHGQGPRRWSV